MKYSKEVLLPISVPCGDFCVDNDGRICSYFDNEGGVASCDINMGGVNYNELGAVEKPEKCKSLVESSKLLSH